VVEIEEEDLDPYTGWPTEWSRIWASGSDGKMYPDGKILVTFAYAKWAQDRTPQEDDLRPLKGWSQPRPDSQWKELVG